MGSGVDTGSWPLLGVSLSWVVRDILWQYQRTLDSAMDLEWDLNVTISIVLMDGNILSNSRRVHLHVVETSWPRSTRKIFSSISKCPLWNAVVDGFDLRRLGKTDWVSVVRDSLVSPIKSDVKHAWNLIDFAERGLEIHKGLEGRRTVLVVRNKL